MPSSLPKGKTLMYLRRADGEKIYIDETMPLGKGGEARVYPVSEFPNWAAKVYFDERATPERAAKLAVMRDHPPRVPIGSDDHVPIAWPVELLYDLRRPGTGGGVFDAPRLQCGGNY